MKKVLWGLFILIFSSLPLSAEEYEFRGKHLVAQYLGCNQEALRDVETLQQVMLKAAESCGAQVIGHISKIFEPHGLTMVIMLSESHASIHTYPEHGACFVDLFTCGDKCDHVVFSAALQTHLRAAKINQKVLVRHHDFEDHDVD